jgi:predicted cupin superfamily sugar epimerase
VAADPEPNQDDEGTMIETTMPSSAEEVIRMLRLEPHPEEGGFFRETYRCDSELEPGPPFGGRRSWGTAIYYLLTADSFSAMHRLPGDEIFHFYLGDPVEMLELLPNGEGRVTILGPDLESMRLQHVVQGGSWQGSRLARGGAWALLGTTMSPGFSYEDYEHATAALLEEYPPFAVQIRERLPREVDGTPS